MPCWVWHRLYLMGDWAYTTSHVFPSFTEWHKHQPRWPSKKSTFYFFPPLHIQSITNVHWFAIVIILELFLSSAHMVQPLPWVRPPTVHWVTSAHPSWIPCLQACFFQCILHTTTVLSLRLKSDPFTLFHYIRFLRTLWKITNYELRVSWHGYCSLWSPA